jgi:hypothetical protein
MKRRKPIRFILLAGLAAVFLSTGIFLIVTLFFNKNKRLQKELEQLLYAHTPVTLQEIIANQNMQQMNLTISISDKRYEFETRKGSFSIILHRRYNFSHHLFDGSHSVGFDYRDLDENSKPTARKIEEIIEKDPLIDEKASTIYSFFRAHARQIKGHIKRICLPAETQTFDGFLSDLQTLVEEDKFSIDEPFEAVLVDNYHPACTQDHPNKLDKEIKAKLLSANNEYTYVSPDEVERLNQILRQASEKGEFDIKTSSFDSTLLCYLRSIFKHFTRYKGEVGYDEKKNRLRPSAILTNPNRIEVSCAPPALYLARMINYANQVNPNFRHIHAFETSTTLVAREGKLRGHYVLHAIVGLVDTENRKITFLNPHTFLILPPFSVRNGKRRANGSNLTTSYRRELIGAVPVPVGCRAGGLTCGQFLEESKRNLRREY